METRFLPRLQKLIQDSIDNSVNRLEEAHLRVADIPFATLEKFSSGPVKKAHKASQRNIAKLYSSIRGFSKKIEHAMTKLLNGSGKIAATAESKVKKAERMVKTAA